MNKDEDYRLNGHTQFSRNDLLKMYILIIEKLNLVEWHFI